MKSLISVLIVGIALWSQTMTANPFSSDDSPPNNTNQAITSVADNNNGLLGDLKRRFSDYQTIIRTKLEDLALDFENKASALTLLLLFLVAFVYGIIHAMGPGHSKSIVFTYLLSGHATIKTGILLGAFSAFFHGINSTILLSVIYYLLQGETTASFYNYSQNLRTVSLSLVIVIGIILLVKAFLNLRSRNVHRKGEALKPQKSIIPMVLALALTPCPGTMLLFVFFLSINQFFWGFLLSIVMATGMALTVSLVGLLAVCSKNRISNVQPKGETSSAVWSLFEIAPIAVMISIAVLILFQI